LTELSADEVSADGTSSRRATLSSGRRARSAGEAAGVRHVLEARVVALEGDGDRLGRTVTVLGDDEVRLAGARGLLLVVVLAVDQEDDVRVLHDRAGLSQVTHHRGLV